MGKSIYTKPEPANVRGVCVLCQTNAQRLNSRGKDGSPTYKPLCRACCRKRHAEGETGRQGRLARKKPYRRHKRATCDLCAFIPKHDCQLDVDHIDGNHENNEPSNLQTLCANCHRLKTFENRDWETRKAL